jgi:hypothetical protein
MRASILLRPSMWFFTVAVGVFVAVMVSVALYPDQSSAKPNDCADENEGVLIVQKVAKVSAAEEVGGTPP